MTGEISVRQGRNEPCHCGSGKKYKQCCLPKDEAKASAARAKSAAEEAAAPAAAEAAVATPKKTHQSKTDQPWKTTTARGFVPRARTPRKVGGG